MSAKINITIRNGNLIAATQEIVQERLAEFAAAHRRVKTLDVSVDVGDPARPVVEIMTPIGEEEWVGKASSDNVAHAVDDAIRRLERKLAERLQERKDQNPEQTPGDRDDRIIKIGVGVAAVLLAGIVGLFMLRADSGLPKVVDVDVTVLYQGEPLAGATVIFASNAGGSLLSGAMATGITDPNGRPTMMTQVSPRIAAEGVAPGEFKVTISKFVPPDGMSDSEYQELVVADMEAVNSGVAQESKLASMVELLDETYSSSAKTTLEAIVSESGENQFAFELE